jgi:hypothetical protein
MSFNRLTYDPCRYSRELGENTNILKYIINDNRYEHPNKCRNEFGLVGGANVSIVRGNIVDMESELRGITRNLSKCTLSKPKPLDEEFIIINDKTQPLDTRKLHLPVCQMNSYNNVPIPSKK